MNAPNPQYGALTCEAQHARNNDFEAVSPFYSFVTAWGRCPQTPEIYRFEPEAWFRRRITMVFRTSACCAYHVNSPNLIRFHLSLFLIRQEFRKYTTIL